MEKDPQVSLRAKKSKRSMIVFLLVVPFVVLVVALWALISGRALEAGRETAAWVAIGTALLSLIIELYTYLTLPDRDGFNVPPGNIRFRFVLRAVEVCSTYYFGLAALGVLLDGLFGLERMIPKPYNWLGIILVLIGGAMGRWTMRTYFSKGKGTTVSYEPTQNLVVEGPFKYMRNPMILGSEILVGGLAIILGSYFLALILFLIVVGDHIYVVRIEEKEMEARFGDAYLEYKKNVPRWIPGTSNG